MKKLTGVLVCLLLFTFISSARIIEVADAGITDKLRAVIAAKNAGVGGNWYDDWSAKVRITVESTVCSSGTLSDFPVMITQDTLPASANEFFDADGSSPAQADGGDIRVYAGDYSASHPATEDTNRIPIEVVSINTDNDPANGYTEIYAKLGTVNCSSDVYITVYYGATGKTQPAIDASYGAEAVWDANYLGVWHFESSLLDSTSNDSDLSATDGAPDYVTSNVVGHTGADFNGTDDGVETTNAAFDDLAEYTAFFYNYPQGYGGSDNGRAWSKLKDTRECWYEDADAPNNHMSCIQDEAGGYRYTRSATGGWNLNAPYYTHVRYSTDDMQINIYWSGTEDASYETQGTITGALDSDAGGEFTIGNRTDDIRAFDGIIDEFRFSNTDRTTQWILAEGLMVSAPATYMTEGSEVDF